MGASRPRPGLTAEVRLDISSGAGINAMIGATPGAVVVSYGGVDGYGHDAHVPTEFGADVGVVVSEPSVVIAAEFFPELGLCEGSGTAEGVGRDITVGDYIWNVRAIEPAESPGEIRLMLSNRRSNTDA